MNVYNGSLNIDDVARALLVPYYMVPGELDRLHLFFDMKPPGIGAKGSIKINTNSTSKIVTSLQAFNFKASQANWRARFLPTNIESSVGYDALADTWGDTYLQGVDGETIAFNDNLDAIQTGRQTISLGSGKYYKDTMITQPCSFRIAFTKPPKVLVFLSGFDIKGTTSVNFKLHPSDVTELGFNLNFQILGGKPSFLPWISNSSFSLTNSRGPQRQMLTK